MAVTNLLALIDDIASVLDDVAVLSKIAAKKTAGVLGDDLALNAQQVAGVQVNRELPVIWAVATGSLWNKAILVPAALLVSTFAPWLVTPLLMTGGAYLCYEGFEKLAHCFLHKQQDDTAHKEKLITVLADPAIDMVAFERGKIRGAVRTDFILSAEIIIIALGTVAAQPLMVRIGVLIAIALLMTIFVYGLVALIIKLDDLGLWLQQKKNTVAVTAGNLILYTAPWLMRFLSVAGTAAMFLVGGGILAHGIPTLTHWLETSIYPADGGIAATLVSMLGNAVFGMIAGSIVLLIVTIVKKLFPGNYSVTT